MGNKPREQDKQKAKAKAEFARALRMAAEDQLAHTPHPETSTRPIKELLHELQVSQIERDLLNDELRRSQLMMENSRDRFADLYEFAPVGNITASREALIDEINLRGATMLGEDRGKLLHRRFDAFIIPEDHDHWHQYFTNVLQSDEKLTCELTILRGDNSRLEVQLDGLRLLRDDKLPLVLIALSDITERKRDEEVVREQGDFFRMITENIEDFFAVLDLEGRRLYNSPSYARLFGNPESLKGTDSFSNIHPDDQEHVKRVFNETVQTGSGLHTEFRFLLADGSIRHMESNGRLIRNSQGYPLRVVVVSRDITERKHAEEQIRNLAFYDTLTQLPNRRMLDDRLNQTMAASKRSGRYGALMFLDMDNFKPLNDQHGHGAGDLLLKEVAHRISSCVREMDTVARFGGDEFVVMLSELDNDKKSSIVQAGIVAEKIRSILSQPYLLTLLQEGENEKTIEHRCTASIGVVMFINHEDKPADLLKQADMVMYQAKESGRNQVRFFNK